MSNIPVSSLPLVVSLDGSETVPLVQGGTTKRALVSQINSANIANIPVGGLTGQGLVKSSNVDYATQWKTVAGFGTVQQVDTGTGLVGGPITLTGTIALASISTGNVLANVSGSSAAPTPQTPSAILDVIGAVRGDILYRGASGWAVLPPSTVGRILTTGGAGADPSWSNVGSGTVTSVALALPSIFTVSGSPVTTTGTLTGALASQTANLVWAGPSTGAAAAPTFRSLVGADLPNPSASTLGGIQSTVGSTNRWISSISTSGIPALTQPAFSDISGVATGAQLPNPSASTLGGVQSLAAVTSRWINTISTTGVPSATQPAFSDILGNATLAQLPSIGNNTILANTSGGSSTPIATGLSTLVDTIGAVQGNVLYRNASAWVALAPGSSGQVLTTGGAAANPAWATVTGTGTVTNIAAGTGIDTGGSPITTTGTVSLASIANQRILANVSGGSAIPIPNTMTSLLDIIGATQGQILYRGASTWTALAPGTSGQYLQTLGAGSTPQWAAAVSSLSAGTGISLSPATITTTGTITNTGVVSVKTQKFISSGTYTPSTGMIYAIVECVGGGGAGGGATTNTSEVRTGGGGGSGGYSRLLTTAAAIGASKAVTIGAAGAGSSNANGTAGGDTSVGTLCIAKGGSGGIAGNPTTFGTGTSGGVAGTGDLTATGSPGTNGAISTSGYNINFISGGNGGSSSFGGAGIGAIGGINTAGGAATGYGGGGGGGQSLNGAGGVAGGAGSAGVVIVTEYCSQ